MVILNFFFFMDWRVLSRREILYLSLVHNMYIFFSPCNNHYVSFNVIFVILLSLFLALYVYIYIDPHKLF